MHYQKSAPESIQEMFATIAENYDRANSTFSLGMHKKWNQRLIQTVEGAELLLDLCAGTGEIGFGFLAQNPDSQAILLDFCPEMLAVAKEKGAAYQERFSVIEGDAQSLPLEDDSVDAVTISYGIRNVKDPLKCFHEVARVLKPGGRFSILELTRPRSTLLRLSHKAYLRFVLPLLGKVAAKNIDAYRYLSKSIAGFASPESLEKDLLEAGLTPIERIPLMGGLSTLFIAAVPSGQSRCSSGRNQPSTLPK